MLADQTSTHDLTKLRETILLCTRSSSSTFREYDAFIAAGKRISDRDLELTKRSVSAHDVCNLQFTSGTTGNPKAAMLTHK